MAGLLAARVLSDSFDCVTIIERDALPAGAAYRSGVPQARHGGASQLRAHEKGPRSAHRVASSIVQEGLWSQRQNDSTRCAWSYASSI